MVSRDFRMKSISWSDNIIEPGQTAQKAGQPGSILVAKVNILGSSQVKFTKLLTLI
jgi:hypothetical protein